MKFCVGDHEDLRGHPDDYDRIDQDDTLHIAELRDALPSRDTVQVDNLTKRTSFTARHQL
jgi:hypothetical protein